MSAGVLGLFLVCAGVGFLAVATVESEVAAVETSMPEVREEQENASLHEAVASFLEASREGAIRTAYGWTSKTFRQRQSLEEFRAYLGRHPELKNLRASDNEVWAQNQQGARTCRVILESERDTPVAGVLDLVQENGRWVVERVSLP
jgi:hypothetical protein